MHPSATCLGGADCSAEELTRHLRSAVASSGLGELRRSIRSFFPTTVPLEHRQRSAQRIRIWNPVRLHIRLGEGQACALEGRRSVPELDHCPAAHRSRRVELGHANVIVRQTNRRARSRAPHTSLRRRSKHLLESRPPIVRILRILRQLEPPIPPAIVHPGFLGPLRPRNKSPNRRPPALGPSPGRR